MPDNKRVRNRLADDLDRFIVLLLNEISVYEECFNSGEKQELHAMAKTMRAVQQLIENGR